MGKTRYTNPADDQLSSLLPEDVRSNELYRQCSLATLGAFARTSQKAEIETAFFRLHSASIHAAPEFLDEKESAFALASIAILKKNPDKLFELLFTKKMVKDHKDREIWASPYQLFLGMGDVWALNQIHEIISLIPDEVNKTKIQEKAQEQFREWFPNYDKKLKEGEDEEARLYDERNERQIAEIVKQLAIVKRLITADPFTNDVPLDVTKQAVGVLCKLFQSTSGEVIRSGLHFPLAIMKEIYKTYDGLPKGWSFFSLNVIFPALYALSTVDEQCCRYGLNKLNMETGPARRCSSAFEHPLGQPLQVKHAKDNAKGVAELVDPYDGDICFSSIAGSFSWFDKNGGVGASFQSRFVCGGLLVSLVWKTYVEQKCQAYRTYAATVHSRSIRPGV